MALTIYNATYTQHHHIIYKTQVHRHFIPETKQACQLLHSSIIGGGIDGTMYNTLLTRAQYRT